MSEQKESDIGLIPKEWEVCTVDDIKSNEKKSVISGPFGSNISAKYFVPTGVPVVRGNNLSLNLSIKFNDSGFVFITEKKADELGTWATKDDLIFTAVGTIGQVGLLTGKESFQNYIISNKQLRLRINTEKVLPLFAYYWFASPKMVDVIIQRNTGSSVPLINLSVLKSLNVPVPSLPEQKAIASVLSSLDDKIDLLHRQNQTLERMAEILFRQWFIEKADEAWRIVKLENIVSLKQGKYVKPDIISDKHFQEFIYPLYGGNGIRGYLSTYDYASAKVAITCRGNGCGLIQLLNPFSTVSNSCIVFDNDDSISTWYLVYCSKHLDFASVTSGSAQPQITITDIGKLEISIPDKETLNKFDEQVKLSEEKILKNQIQIRTLEKLRDTLLPKLMSGEVRVEM